MDIEEARRRAHLLLGPLGHRWRHTCGVARAARRLGVALVPDDGEMLEAAAWLHDIGYAPTLANTGFHPLDGARWLSLAGEFRLAGLVAHHTGAAHEAARRGLGAAIRAFGDEASLVSAALAFCDLTTGPRGESVTPGERLADIEVRHGPGSVVVESLHSAWPSLTRSVRVVERELLGVLQPM